MINLRGRRQFLGALLCAALSRPPRAVADPRSHDHIGVSARPVLDALADTIVPRDADPGALDAGVPARILQALESDRAGRLLYRDGLALVDAIARRSSGRPFASLDAETRERVIGMLVREPSDVARQFFGRVRQDVLRFYWASEAGQKAVGYHPLAAGYPDYAEPPAASGVRAR